MVDTKSTKRCKDCPHFWELFGIYGQCTMHEIGVRKDSEQCEQMIDELEEESDGLHND